MQDKELVFVLMDSSAYHILESWHTAPELRRRISPPDSIWFEYVQNTSGVFAWMILENGNPVGHLQLDCKPNGTGYFGFLVKPELWNCGYGKRILRAFMTLPDAAQLRAIKAEVEADNLASIKCLKAVGFRQEDPLPDKNGFLHFVYKHATDDQG